MRNFKLGQLASVLSAMIADAMPAPTGSSKTVSPANRRADRLYMLRRAHAAANTPEDGARYTRQRARAEQRDDAKEMRSLRKAQAMRSLRPGGAAAVQ